MNKPFICVITLVTAVVAQVSFFPSFLVDPYKPNLILPLVVFLGFKKQNRWWGLAAFALGLVQDTFSGLYTGLHAFSYLMTFFVLRAIAGRLYTDSSILMTLTVFIASVLTTVTNVILLLLFSAADGIMPSVAYTILPQAAVNAVAALVLFSVPALVKREAL